MATKAERFKASVERKGPKRRKRTAKAGSGARRMEKGKAAERELRGTTEPAPHNHRARAKDGSAYEYEVTAKATKPSRKSTRASSGHVKHGIEQQLRHQNKLHSSQERAARSRKGGA